MDESFENITITILDSINEDFTSPVTVWEVKLAMFAMHPEKKSLARQNDIFVLSNILIYSEGKNLIHTVNNFLFNGFISQEVNY